jgi:IS5 family transposase
MHRKMGNQSMIEAFLPEQVGRNERLERMDEVVDWNEIGNLVENIYSAREGKPSYPPLMMVKVLILQQWYNASDPEMEAALLDRLSFRRFVGLALQDDSPDHSTISRFRKQLTDRGLGEKLFEELGRQLDNRGLIVKKGTLMDATLVEAQVRRPSMSAGAGAKSTTDPDADWTRKGHKSYFGYKVHVGVDAGSGLVRTAVLTPAKVNDSEVADGLISRDEAAVYADRAYESKARRRWLKSIGINDRIMHRSHKNQPGLPHWQQRRNNLISRVRAPVEKVFGTLKRTYGYRRVRYMGHKRNETEMWFKLMAYNLRRADRLILTG